MVGSNLSLSFMIHCKRAMQVADIPDHFILVTDSQDIEAIKDHFGRPEWMDYGCYFVEICDGSYGTIYGCESSVPYLTEWVDELW
jgi:hypothetical protein